MKSPLEELIARAFGAFNRRDETALLSLCHPEIEWIPMRASIQGRVYQGHLGVRDALADVGEEFEELRNYPRHYTEVAPGRVVVSGRVVAKEREGGLRVDIPGAWLGEVRDGKVAYMRAFPDEQSALRAAGERQ